MFSAMSRKPSLILLKVTTFKRLLALWAQRLSKRLAVATSGRLGGRRPPEAAAGGCGRPLASAPPLTGTAELSAGTAEPSTGAATGAPRSGCEPPGCFSFSFTEGCNPLVPVTCTVMMHTIVQITDGASLVGWENDALPGGAAAQRGGFRPSEQRNHSPPLLPGGRTSSRAVLRGNLSIRFHGCAVGEV